VLWITTALPSGRQERRVMWPGTATTGARAVKVSESTGLSALVPITILGSRQIVLTPSGGGVGTTVSVSGSGFDASQLVNIVGLDAAFNPAPTDFGAPVTTSSTGTLTGSIQINNVLTRNIAAAEADNPATEVAVAPFAFSADSCVPTNPGPDADDSTSNGCDVLQTVTEVVSGTTLTFSQAGSQVTLTPTTLNGTDQTATGALQALTVLDARGSLTGWTVIATATDFADAVGGTHHTIPASSLDASGITCAPQSSSTGDAADVVAGSAGSFDNSTALTLCTAASGGGGGTFDIGSDVSLLVPASVAAGTYTSTVTITVT